MLYAILKPVFRTALRLYFGRIVAQGLEHIDNGRPTIILANHTASFMDAVITAVFVRRQIHFFTRGDVFKNRVIGKVLRSFGMLPVYRLTDGKEMLQLNDSSNEEALRILATGGAVLIYCEGASNIAKVLKPMKKGPFRLAVDAARRLEIPPLLVSLGINYVTPTRPFGDVFLNAAPPVSSSEFITDESDSSAREATIMMRSSAASLGPLVWHVDRVGMVPLYEKLLAVLAEVRPNYSFSDSQELLAFLNYSEPREIESIVSDLDECRLWQRQYKVHSTQHLPKPKFREWLLVIIGSPIAITGILTNYFPLSIARSITGRKVQEPDFIAAIFVSLATSFLLIWYGMWVVISLQGDMITRYVMNPVTMAICGWFYLKIYRNAWQKVLGTYHRFNYRRLNPSYAMVDRLHTAVRQFVKMAITARPTTRARQ